MHALLLLTLGCLQDAGEKKVDLEKTKLFLYDASRGMTLRVHDDGRVDLAVKEKDGQAATAYTARSAEAFRKAYPDVVRRYDLGRQLGGAAVIRNEFDDWWDRQKKQWSFRRMPDLGRRWDEDWWKEQQKMLEDLRRRLRPGGPAPAPVPAPRSGEFGVKVVEPEETLREQLSLGKEEGVLVTFVKPGSAAAKAGVKRFDLFVKLDGKKVTDKWSFRKDVYEALSRPGFELETIRGGKRMKLLVGKPGNK